MYFNNTNSTKEQTDWNNVNWRKANRIVKNLRQRIFRATAMGDWKKVRSLQKLMLRSYSNCLLAVRKVTQQNQGKKTPGIDKVLVKTPTARGKLVDKITNNTPWKVLPARRIYIPKANGKKRPLGIPVIQDRCLQAIVKNALEPEWEAQFEGSSYGFRPGRSAHDAIQRIYVLSKGNSSRKWIVDADIQGCFDNINQEFLLQQISRFPAKEQIKQWLKAGFIEISKREHTWNPTETGTPQGGIISPLLANIALHGMEKFLNIKYTKDGRISERSKRAMVRYADDFVVFCKTQEDAEQVIKDLQEWMQVRGLSLSSEKTKIVHTSKGFDFLGFNIKQYPRTTTKSGWKPLIKPSKKSVQRLKSKVREIWFACKGKPVEVILEKLNPIIMGWANYFRTQVSKKTFHDLDYWMYIREQRWVKYSHPRKPDRWREAKYWGRLNLDRYDNWVFGDKQTGRYLLKFSWFPIQRHTLVELYASPDDPNLREYWRKRNKTKVNDQSPGRQKIARRQGYICPVCGESLFNGEELHLHHKTPKRLGGKDSYENLQFVHLFCHQQIHSQSGKADS
ncbi:group II intron reverse transcriptase/maturase [Pelatocladus sp. BLCC-F211]|uniref:group II intron reverse transcriptase/maturase n=1 Tax=Pelatocladus sp. BLCC-F211 TaxID=3342752 RepID=UPI0035B99839